MEYPRFEGDRVINAALAEDVGLGDITTLSTVPGEERSAAHLVAKEELLLAGLPAFFRVFALLDPDDPVVWESTFKDGDRVQAGETIAVGKGSSRTLLTGERTALNILQRLSGIATMTADWASELAGTKTRLIDTRKTTPGLRALEKYAVRVGGGANHRIGLFDGVLIKENHIRAAGSIAKAVASAKKRAPHTLKVEVEVTNLEELKSAIEAGADAVLLDNMDNATLAEAALVSNGRLILEASGNMSKERLASVAQTGVDLISAGALTHSAPSVDLSLLFK
ncbi:MAG: nicotinate-nucleotide diphosphorylase (carboxylating) [Deltaproteobacteria bacterium]|nr:MAG: nicotinate-nucleotide diphosphorylase (carboxylating) [Deltaproteobacteria bacterium]